MEQMLKQKPSVLDVEVLYLRCIRLTSINILISIIISHLCVGVCECMVLSLNLSYYI